MKEKEDFEPSNSNSDLSSVASHSSASSNSIEQIVTRVLTETTLAVIDWIKEETVIKDEAGNELPGAIIDLKSDAKKLTPYIYRRLEKHGINIKHDPETCGCGSHSDYCPYNPSSEYFGMLNSGQEVKESDTTMLNSSTEADKLR